MTEFAVDYSGLDRMVHKLAMRQLETQKFLSSFEDRGFDRVNADVTAADPVFITSLPRAGTTLLLEVVAGAPEFAAHTYRQMPFLLCPLLWDRVSRGFRKATDARERAHGDGMLVGYDSVEAFEEILWRAFWPEHFESNRIRPWAAEEVDENGEFVAFMRQHMRKIIGLKRAATRSAAAHRYVSKNNANISRLGWLESHYPDAVILIPYRNPAGHIGSLIRQHGNFLEAHAREPFVLHYMETIGHLEFGKALRPIDFDRWLAKTLGLDPTSANFWAEYWIVAFEAILRTAGPHSVLFSYDRLCAKPDECLEALESRLGADGGSFISSAGRFRRGNQWPMPPDIGPDRVKRIEELVAQLDSRALF